MRLISRCGSFLACLVLATPSWAEPPEPAPFRLDATSSITGQLVEESIARQLDEETRIDVIETPFADVIKDIGKSHELTIVLDPEGLEAAGVTPDQLISLNLKGISLRSALRILLEPLHLTSVIRNETLTITGLDCSESAATSRVFPVKKLLAAIDKPDDLVKALRAAWPKSKEGQCEPGASIVAGQLVVRGSPRHHDVAEKLIADLYTSLEVEPPKKTHPLQRWVPGKSVRLVNMDLSGHDLKLLAGQAQIQDLDLAFNSNLNDDDMLVLTTLPDLTSLNLSGTSVGESTLTIIAGLKSLETLDLSSTRVGPHVGAVLGSLPKLKHLRLASAGLPDLTFLEKTPNLISLDVHGNVQLTEKDLDWIAKLKHLQKLNLREIPITEKGLDVLSSVKSLQQLEIGHNRYCGSFDRSNIEEVPWPHCTPAEVDELRRKLPECKIEANLTEFRSLKKPRPAELEEEDPFGK